MQEYDAAQGKHQPKLLPSKFDHTRHKGKQAEPKAAATAAAAKALTDLASDRKQTSMDMTVIERAKVEIMRSNGDKVGVKLLFRWRV